METLAKFQALIILALNLVLALAIWALRAQTRQEIAQATGGLASKDVVVALDERLDGHEGRLTSMEAALRHLPTADQIHALTVAVADVRGDLRAMNATVVGVEKALHAVQRRLDLMDEHLKRAP